MSRVGQEMASGNGILPVKVSVRVIYQEKMIGSSLLVVGYNGQKKRTKDGALSLLA